MNCELISVGTEILLGDILNTNVQYLSKELASLGIGVMHHSTVGDNSERLREALDLAFSRCELVILTGGLGPTPDDLTKETCAEYFGLGLYEDEDILRDIESYFNNKKISMPECNKKQALVPENSIILKNRNGTAPGFIAENKGRIIVVLPGPPKEMEPMFRKEVKEYLKKYTEGVILSHNIRTFGVGESAMSERVEHLLSLSNPTVAPYAKSGEALLRVTAKAESEEEAEKLMEPVIAEIKQLIGDYIYGIDVDSVERATVDLLKEKKLTVALAESCTGGLCAKRLTDISGASEVFHCGVVSYSNEIKHKVLGVKKEHLEKYTAVSPIVAAEMAIGARKLGEADFGAAVTGYAGPFYEGCEDPVGLIYIAVTDGELIWLKKLVTGHNKGESARDYNRTVSASNVINEIRLLGKAYPEKRSEGIKIHEFFNSFSEEKR
ncbi:MAG: competence/damage-inducible protein A [Acutalibacteraceae bacterium]|nr:competence/damage-inducible protein A [Acutalibacteraceae bacterium]